MATLPDGRDDVEDKHSYEILAVRPSGRLFGAIQQLAAWEAYQSLPVARMLY